MISQSGGPFTIVVTATIAPTAAAFNTFANPVSIGSASPELETANNAAQAATYVGRFLYLPLITR
jgi:hypothetical protein